MSEIDKIKQSQTLGAQGTQIGIQYNYVGITPQAASEMAINLFMKNFPELVEEARKTVRERVDELIGKIVHKLENKGVKDFSAFTEPDVQHALLEAEKGYARFGTNEMLETLSELLCKRVQNDKDFKLKVTIDKAIEIASMITIEQINYLSYLFDRDYAKETDNGPKHLKKPILKSSPRFLQISQFIVKAWEDHRKKKVKEKSKDSEEDHTKEDNNAIDFNDIQYLLMHGCLILNLHSVTDRYISRPECAKKHTKDWAIQILNIIGPVDIGTETVKDDDYSLSYVGIILAITNKEIKTGLKLDPHEWIK